MGEQTWTHDEKSAHNDNDNDHHQPCHHHANLQTPHIDAQLRQPNARAALLALSAAFAAAAEENRCLQCVLGSAVQEVTQCLHDFKKQQKQDDGEWSKADKKAMKKEVKVLSKGVKRDAKSAWKGNGGKE